MGCDGVLVKPFEPQIVISRVKDLLAGRQPSGMWSAGPVAQGPVRQAPAPFNARPAQASGSSSDPLEAYFDHLDAAFNAGAPAAGGPGVAPPTIPPRREPIPVARMQESAPPAANASSNDPFADWDPDLVGDPSRPAPLQAPPERPAAAAPPHLQLQAPEPAPAPVALVPVPAAAAPAPGPARAAAAPAPPARPPSLVDAFAALLAAEQRIGLSPSTATTPAPAGANATGPAAAAVTDELIEKVTARVVSQITDQSRHTILDVAERLVREEIERIRQNS